MVTPVFLLHPRRWAFFDRIIIGDPVPFPSYPLRLVRPGFVLSRVAAGRFMLRFREKAGREQAPCGNIDFFSVKDLNAQVIQPLVRIRIF